MKTPTKLLISGAWILSLVVIGFLSFSAGKNSKNSASVSLQNVPVVSLSPTSEVLGVQEVNAGLSPTSSVDLTGICKKSGLSQKSEFLPSYTIKDGDTLQAIASSQLGDPKRLDELMTLNSGTSGLSAGSTLYFPPSSIKQSSGHLVQVSGMIVKKDNAVWQLSYGGGEKGLGLVIPTYYFNDVANTQGYTLGDCVTIFLDDGVKAYTVVKQ